MSRSAARRDRHRGSCERTGALQDPIAHSRNCQCSSNFRAADGSPRGEGIAMSTETCICPDPIGGNGEPARSMCSSVPMTLFISGSAGRVVPTVCTRDWTASDLYMTDIGCSSDVSSGSQLQKAERIAHLQSVPLQGPRLLLHVYIDELWY